MKSKTTTTTTPSSSDNTKVSTESTRNWQNWTSQELADYIQAKLVATGGGVAGDTTTPTTNSSNYAELFVTNNITGAVAPQLTDENLKEMGITTVGDRIRIQQALQQLQENHAQQEREQVLWTGEQILFTSWFQQCCATCGGCCPQDPSTYTLRRHHLEIKTVHPCRLGPIRCCCTCLCAETYEIDNVDLSDINDTDVHGIPPGCLSRLCCCALIIENVVITTNNHGTKTLTLPKDEGQAVARKLKQQVEVMQKMERS